MAPEWAEVRIGDLGRVVTGRTPPGNDPAYYGPDIPFLTPSDMVGHRRVERTARSLSTHGSEELARCIVPRGVGVSCIGWQMGKAILIDRPTITNQQINSVIVNEAIADRGFVYYSLLDRRDEVFSLGAAGSRTPILNKGDFERLSFVLPPLPEQRAIAHVLGKLDDKLELNRLMNETLEAMAQVLFKSWFVDFGPVRAKVEGRDPGLPQHLADLFPDSFEDSELGETPEGWDLAPLSECVEAVRGLSYKGSGLSASGLPMHNLNSIYEGGGYKYEGLKHYQGDYKPQHVARAGDVLVANTEQGHDRLLIGFAAIVPERFQVESLFSHHIYRVRARTGSTLTSDYVCHLLNTRVVHEIVSGYANGTTVNMLPIDALERPRILLPPEPLVAAFSSLAEAARRRHEEMVEESRTLTALRDTLLPKLISGELRLKNAERIAARATA